MSHNTPPSNDRPSGIRQPAGLWLDLKLFPTPEDIENILREHSNVSGPTDQRAHLASTIQGVEPDIHLIPQIMRNMTAFIRNGEQSKAEDCLALFDRWKASRPQQAVLHHTLLQAICMKNVTLCKRILDKHDLTAVFLEQPLLEAAKNSSVEIVEEIVRNVTTQPYLDAAPVAFQLGVAESDEKVTGQVKLNRAGIIAAAMEHTRNSDIQRCLITPLLYYLDASADYNYDAFSPAKAFVDSVMATYQRWQMPNRISLLNRRTYNPVMPNICLHALRVCVLAEPGVTWNAEARRYDWTVVENASMAARMAALQEQQQLLSAAYDELRRAIFRRQTP